GRERDGRRRDEQEGERRERRSIDRQGHDRGHRDDGGSERGRVPRVGPANRSPRERDHAPEKDLADDREEDGSAEPTHEFQLAGREHVCDREAREEGPYEDRAATALRRGIAQRRDDDARNAGYGGHPADEATRGRSLPRTPAPSRAGTRTRSTR